MDKSIAERKSSLSIELFRRVLICVVAFLGCMVISFYPLTGWVLVWLKGPANKRVENFDLVFKQPLEYWSMFFLVSFLVAIAIAMPVFIWQLLRLLDRKPQQLTSFASAMFVIGCLAGYYWIPSHGWMDSLGSAGSDIQPYISVKSYIGYFAPRVFGVGLLFELSVLVGGLLLSHASRQTDDEHWT